LSAIFKISLITLSFATFAAATLPLHQLQFTCRRIPQNLLKI